MNIALIDDGINQGHINLPQISAQYSVSQKKIMIVNRRSSTLFSHGTICAAIIGKIYPEVCFTDMQILNKAGMTSIDSLISALEWCYYNSIKLIHMSLGTLNYHDAQKMEPIISSLVSKDVCLIAAFHNGSLISYPAFFPRVFGVRRDNGTVLQEGEYTFDNCSNLNAEHCLVAHPYNKLETYSGEIDVSCANSYAAPVITGHIAKFLNQKTEATFTDVLSFLQSNCSEKEYSVKQFKKYFASESFTTKKPIIVFPIEYYDLMNRIYRYFLENGYSVESFSDMPTEENIISIENYLSETEQITHSLLFTLDIIYEPSVMLFALKNNRYDTPINFTLIDAFIDATHDGYRLTVESFSNVYKTPRTLFEGILRYFDK